MANSTGRCKADERHPDVIAYRKYQHDIAIIEKKRDKAFEQHDWSMRNFYDAQLSAKRFNCEKLHEKLRRRFYGL